MNGRTVNKDIQSQELRIFEAVPGNNLLIKADSPRFTIVAASESFLRITGKSKDELIGKGIFEGFPSNPANPQDNEALVASFQEVMTLKKGHILPVQRYDFQDEGNAFVNRFWRIVHTPVLDLQGDVAFIINTVEDITHEMVAGQREEQMKSLEKAQNMFSQAPLSIVIIKGPDLIVEMANEMARRIWDRDVNIIGRPLLDLFPELKDKGFDTLLTEVMRTGTSKSFYEVPIELNKGGKKELGYYNYIYQPYYEEDQTKATGVLVFSSEVTEKVIAREKIKESELRLDMANEIAELGVYHVDLKSGTATFTRPLMDWLGTKDLHLPIKDLLTKIYPDDRQMVTDHFNRSFAKDWEGRHNVIFRLIEPESGQLQYLNSVGQVEYVNNVPVSIIGVMRNVTEEVLANKKLKESEQKLRSIIDNAPFAIAVLRGEEMRIELANQNIMDAWGKGDVRGKTYYEMLPELGSQGVFERLKESYETGLPVHARHQHLYFLVDGKKQHYYYNYSFIPLYDDSGKVYATTVTATDITDLIISRKQVEESSKNFREMIMQAPVAMCILREPSHIVEIVNDRQLELWGKERSQVMNKPIVEALPEIKDQGLVEVLDRVFSTGEIYTADELPLSILRNGQMELVYINLEYRPYRNVEGKIGGLMAVASEVTDLVLARHKIEEEVAKRTRELAQVNYALQQNNLELEQFAYVAAHDLQEPLRTISNFVGLFVKQYGSLNPDAEIYTRFISTATQRLQNLIKDLLDYSTIRNDVPFVRVNLNEVVGEVVKEMNPVIKANNVSIISNDLPVIMGNSIDLKRVFHHLLSNAIKFQKKENLPQIVITSKTSVETYHIAVQDNGIGIEKSYLDKLFVIFQRLHHPQEYSGTGIGLAICKKVVNMHGGTIWVESEPGKGSTFHFILPKNSSNENLKAYI